MKILVTSITDSGIYRVRKEILKKLISLGHSIIVVSPYGKDVSKIENIGCKFINIKINAHGTNPIKDLYVCFEYAKILKREKPNVVLTFTAKPNVYCGIACRILQIPVISNITGLGIALANSGYKQKLLITLYKLASKVVIKLFFQNSSNMNFFKEHRIGDENKYQLIPGSGINLEDYPYQKYPELDETIHLLYISRIQKEKGIEEYLKAAEFFRKDKNLNIIFHVLGSCNKKFEPIIHKAHEQKIIMYHGRVNNIPEFQKMSHATIMPSYYPEGICNVLLEASATGRPVITTDQPGCREVVEDNITGFLVQPKNAKSLITGINKLLTLTNQERAEMGRKGREKMKKEFNRQFVVTAYVDCINNLEKNQVGNNT